MTNFPLSPYEDIGKKMQTITLILSFVFLFAGCTSHQVKESQPTITQPTTTPTARPEKTEEIIDVVSLQKFLRMDYAKEKLGYSEKTFNTCAVGFGYSSSQNCRQMYAVSIYYQVKCRQSEGTISTILTDADLTPVESSHVKWSLKNVSGFSSTDSYGYGQIQTVSNQSQRHQRLRLAVGENFLYMRASDITTVVVPKDWCP